MLKGIPERWKAVNGGVIILPRDNLSANAGSNMDLLLAEVFVEIVALNYLDWNLLFSVSNRHLDL